MTTRSRLLIGALALLPLAGCASSTAPDGPSSAALVHGDVEYSAETLVMESFPVQLNTIVRMRNRSSRPVQLQLATGCPVLLEVYRDEARTELVWNQAALILCTQQIQLVDLEPGETEERSTRTDARQILESSDLPDGRYWLSARVTLVGETIEVPAGSVELAIPR